LPTTSKGEGIAGQGEACRFRRRLRGKTHSSHGGRKAHLNFEVKDLRRPEAARQSKSDLSDFDIVNADLGNSRDRIASLTSKFRYAPVCRAMNGEVWPRGRFCPQIPLRCWQSSPVYAAHLAFQNLHEKHASADERKYLLYPQTR
jgi:hypothetical protein